MRITKRTNIAIRVLMFCGANADRLVTKSEIAACCNTSESHLAQVINRLAQLGFLHTQRGRSGGITLARPMNEIVILDEIPLNALVCENVQLLDVFVSPRCMNPA